MTPEQKAKVIEILKAHGLNVAEEAAEGSLKAAFEVMEYLLPAMYPAVAAFVIPIVALAKPKIFEAVDKIDGQVG